MAQVYTAVTFGAEGFRAPSSSSACAPSWRASRDAVGAVHRRGEAAARRWCTRTSCRCSTSARSATSTSWRRSTSSGRDLGAAGRALRSRCTARALPPPLVALRRARDAAGAGVRAHQAGRRRPADGHRPPRRLAQQHPGVGARRGEAVRLRHRQGRGRVTQDPARRRQGQRQLHVARAGARQRRRRARRSVLAGAGHLLLPDRRGAVPGADHLRAAGQGGHRSRRRRAGAHRRPPRAVRGDRRARRWRSIRAARTRPRPSSAPRWRRTRRAARPRRAR